LTAEYEGLLNKSRLRHKDILKNLKRLSKLTKPDFDRAVRGYDAAAFARIDCRRCGNCCRNYGPRFRESDIKAICKSAGLDRREFADAYLEPDSDGTGYQLRKLPCPFQAADNSCSEYEHRTLSCRQFPHTSGGGIQKKLAGLALDSLVCPAAYLICERIIAEY
jgi:Fe-S-cluster containining protein